VQYRDCQLTYTFPDGIKFGVIAKQFGAHSCVTPMHRPAWHNEHRFVILRYDGKVPALASWPDASASSSRRPRSYVTRVEPRSIGKQVRCA
jgi:hypothetical protein